ncbi:MAG TPA: alkaline phosphatase family protein [Nocardioidaceae bacterium]|nr:alkaline phosphatase family protein [Nocardioidaceae bacterium]
MARRRLAAVALAAGVLVAPAGMAKLPPVAATAASTVPDPQDDRVRRVVAISVDGLSPTAIRRLGRAGTPSLHRMIARGASTLDARTLRESTSTLPNHTGMVTGRRVSASAGGHGVVVNNDDGTTVHDAAGEYVHSVFDVVHDHGGTTALYAGKTKFDLLDRSWNTAYGAPDGVQPDHGPDKIDGYLPRLRTGLLVSLLVRQLRQDPATFTFLHLRLPDSAGHRYGYLSRPYLRAVRRTDALVGRVLATVNRERSLRRHTAVVLTADHGGHGGDGSRAHGDPWRPGNYRIPFLAWGATVARGADLYALNPDRHRPGPRRTGYRGRQPVRNADLANLATDLLDLPAVPGSRLNQRADLDVH